MYNEAKAAPTRMRVNDQQLAVAWNWRGVCQALVTYSWKWHCKRKGKEVCIYHYVENHLVHKNLYQTIAWSSASFFFFSFFFFFFFLLEIQKLWLKNIQQHILHGCDKNTFTTRKVYIDIYANKKNLNFIQDILKFFNNLNKKLKTKTVVSWGMVGRGNH